MPPTYKRNLKNSHKKQVINADSLANPKLTSKQKTFADYILEGKHRTEAYKLAYGDESNAASNALRNMRNEQILRYIRLNQRLGLDSASITKDSHLTDLGRLRELAVENGQIAAGVQAEHYRGKVAGLYQDKIDLTVGMSDDVILLRIKDLLGEETAKAIGQGLGTSLENKLLNAPPLLEYDGESDS